MLYRGLINFACTLLVSNGSAFGLVKGDIGASKIEFAWLDIFCSFWFKPDITWSE